MTIEIWTDGSCLGNPGPGGWAFLVRENGEDITKAGAEGDTTNNRMELMAAIMAVSHIPEGSSATIHADSQYVGNGIQSWISGWKRNGWQTSSRQPVKNVDLWKRLDDAVAKRSITWRWVKGHANSAENNLVDQLARNAAIEVSRAQGTQFGR